LVSLDDAATTDQIHTGDGAESNGNITKSMIPNKRKIPYGIYYGRRIYCAA
jgi:hypothetical protein